MPHLKRRCTSLLSLDLPCACLVQGSWAAVPCGHNVHQGPRGRLHRRGSGDGAASACDAGAAAGCALCCKPASRLLPGLSGSFPPFYKMLLKVFNTSIPIPPNKKFQPRRCSSRAAHACTQRRRARLHLHVEQRCVRGEPPPAASHWWCVLLAPSPPPCPATPCSLQATSACS